MLRSFCQISSFQERVSNKGRERISNKGRENRAEDGERSFRKMLVAHACKPSNSGSTDLEGHGLSQPWANTL
jgi:hypothetical protein